MDDSRKERLVLFITTLAGLSCILQNQFGGWEFWVPWIVAAAGIALWWIHLAERLSSNTRLILYFVYAALLLFYYGVHDTSIFDISVSALLFMVVFSLADRISMLNLILIEYAALMALQFFFLCSSGEDLRSFDKMRVVYHVGAVFVMYLFSRISVKHRLSESMRVERWQESIKRNDGDMQDFLSNVSHELRTPANMINGMATLMLRDGESEGLRSMQDAGLRLAHQIGDIQDYTEIRRNELVLEEEDYRIDTLIHNVARSYNATYKKSKPELVFDVSPETPAVLRGDIRKIYKIFRHLLDNAVKFTRRGGIEVKVFALSPENKTNLIIEVTDTGIGMTRAEMARATKGLYQANKKRNRSTGGIGIGLAIVYGFAHKMGGFVMINSEKGRGTTVRVTIPEKVVDSSPCHFVKEESGSGISSFAKQDNEKYSFPGVRALVVDDEPMNLVVATGLLRECKMIPETAESGMEAIKMFETGDYDIIFMDHMMPGMDGVEAMKEIRQLSAAREKATVIVALTANALSGAREMFLKEGFDGFIAKPIDMGEFVHVVKSVLPEDLVRYEGREVKDLADVAKWHRQEEETAESSEDKGAEGDAGTEGGHAGKRAVAILTGSMTDLPVFIRRELEIEIIPSKIYTDEGIFYDNIDMDCEEILRYMGDERKSVTSDAPSVEEYIRFFTSEQRKAEQLIFITLTPSSSHEYGRVIKAAEHFEHVTIINSECVSSATGILAMIAAILAKQQLPVEQIIAEVEKAKKQINCSFVIKTTDVMARRKRISPTMNKLLKTLWLRPMLQTKNDELKVGRLLLGNVRNCYEKYIRVALPKGKAPDTSFAFATYAGMDEEDILWIEEELKRRGKFEHIIFQKASAGITTNCGEGSFGILYLTKTDRDYPLGALFDRWEEPGSDIEEDSEQGEADSIDEPDLAGWDPELGFLPESEAKWYEKLAGIDGEAAVKNSGSEEGFRTVLKIFYDSIPKKAEELEGYYTTGDWENYTIKVHALKSSAKLIGALELAETAQSLENAGKAGDVTFIDIHHKGFLNEYRKYTDRLSGVFEGSDDAEEKESVDDDALQGMYQEIRKAAEEMDCDAVDEVVEKLSKIAPPEAERERIEAIIQRAGDFDYDGILAALEEGVGKGGGAS